MCAFSPGGRLLATSGEQGIVELWDMQSGTRQTIETGHFPPVEGLVVSPDGLTLATIGTEGQVRLWNVATLNEMAVLPMSSPVPLNVMSNKLPSLPYAIGAFSSDGRQFAAFSYDFGRMYDTRSGEATPRSRAGVPDRSHSNLK
jgi:WD40 repeat protein